MFHRHKTFQLIGCFQSIRVNPLTNLFTCVVLNAPIFSLCITFRVYEMLDCLVEILSLHCNVVYSWNVGYYFCLKIFWIVSSLKEFRPSIGWSKYCIFFFLLSFLVPRPRGENKEHIWWVVELGKLIVWGKWKDAMYQTLLTVPHILILSEDYINLLIWTDDIC